jgi:hypothetical protein
MSRKHIPGFVAEFSVYKTSDMYRSAFNGHDTIEMVEPQSCRWWKRALCATAVAGCSVGCAAVCGATVNPAACAACFIGCFSEIGMAGCIDCV